MSETFGKALLCILVIHLVIVLGREWQGLPLSPSG